jgi:hypothetical protein
VAEEERGFAPSDPGADEALPALERPRAPGRELMRLGWAALAVFAVIGVLIVVELVRISSAVNNNGCIQRAQTQFLQAQGPGVTPFYAGLDRLAGQTQLRKCS